MTDPVAWTALRAPLAELAPLARRCQQLEVTALVRLRSRGGHLAAFARLPFDVLASRAVSAEAPEGTDVTVRAGQLLRWLDDPAQPEPPRQDELWRGALPPSTGWRRLRTVPDGELRPLVRTGALAAREASSRQGIFALAGGGTDALLDEVVLAVPDGTATVGVTLRTVSALTRMGFLARDSVAHVDVAGRWTRLAGLYGSVYAEAGLQLR
jgi:hypothetical protein